MNFITNLKIGARLGLAFCLTLCLMLAVAGVGLNSIANADQLLSLIIEDNVKKLMLSNHLNDQVHTIAGAVSTAALLSDPAAKAVEIKKVETAREAYKASREALQRLPANEAATALLTKIDVIADETRVINDTIIKLAQANKVDDAIAAMQTQSMPKVAVWQKLIDDFSALQIENVKTSEASGHAQDALAIKLLIGFPLFALVLSAGVAWLTTRSITQPLARAIDFASRIREGDLTSTINGSGRDETSQVLDAMCHMQTSLINVVSEVRGNAESVATASAEISQGNADLSQRTEEQASALQQTAATMEELGTTVRHNADNALQANQLAQSASTVAAKGGDVVGQVVETMKGISDSSRRIADIIGTIDGIAFQTNILALNAAVEAARAGEQGRGFAVVASEVRSLAQRSAEAAKEIKTLIGASTERVEQGTALVDRAGQTMSEVVSSIQRVTDIVAEISAASSEQSNGIAQVGQAVSQMDQVTQQNAALVEESAAAAESLKGQAAVLVQVVSKFKISQDPSAHTSHTPPGLHHDNHTERRSPSRAKNVTRPAFGKKPQAYQPKSEPKSQPGSTPQAAQYNIVTPPKTGTDDEWTSF